MGFELAPEVERGAPWRNGGAGGLRQGVVVGGGCHPDGGIGRSKNNPGLDNNRIQS